MSEPALQVAVSNSMLWLENQHPQICTYLLLSLCLLVALLIWRTSINRATGKKITAATVTTPKANAKWHSLSTQEVLNSFEVEANQGLLDKAIERQRAIYGLNSLPECKPKSVFVRFIAQFHNLLIYVLIGTASITLVLGHWTDTGVILTVVILNAIFGFVQEGKAENALKGIRQMLSVQAVALRNGRRNTVPAEALVPGDIVFLQAGGKVPADLRLLKANNLQLQEAVLTGESIPLKKFAESVASDAVLSDRNCMAYSGTLVTTGQASGIVVATGVDSEIGRISVLAAKEKNLTTPLLRPLKILET